MNTDQETQDVNKSPLDRFADNTLAKLIRTYLVPALLAVALWLGNEVWESVKTNSAQTAQGITELRSSMAEVKQSVAVQSAIFGDKTKQIDSNTDGINALRGVTSNHEARIEVLEADKGIRR